MIRKRRSWVRPASALVEEQEPDSTTVQAAPVEEDQEADSTAAFQAAPVEEEEPDSTSPARPSPAADSGQALVGQTLGAYQVLEKIGQGGMAIVYKGWHETLDRHVAIKVLNQSIAGLPDLGHRFEKEARTLAALRHPHIVQVFDFGLFHDQRYLVMEYVEGTDLHAAMKLRALTGQPWTPEEILQILGQIGDALDYAHRQGVIHRDLKPANILLTPEGQSILTDFGLSAIRKGRTSIISTVGQAFGTPEYVAPEQAMDYQDVSPQSDLYSLGCILYELVTGHLVFESDSPLSLAMMHFSQDPIPPSHYVPDLPPAVEAEILRALAKDPQRRHPTARVLMEGLRQAWAASLPATSTTSVELSEEEARLIAWAVEENNSRLSVPNIQERLGLSPHFARELVRRWKEAGWLETPVRRQPHVVTEALVVLAMQRLACPPGTTSGRCEQCRGEGDEDGS